MIYSLLVLSSPCAPMASRHALGFARACLEQGHQIERVFFMDAGAGTGGSNYLVPQDQPDLVQAWSELGNAHNLDMVLCVSSALKYGVFDNTEAQRYDKKATLAPGFTISGLGQLSDATQKSERLLTFGGGS